MNRWKEIWNNRTGRQLECASIDECIMELKRQNGFDIVEEEFDIESVYDQFEKMRRELSFYGPVKSIFEVGCGSGPNLLMAQNGGIKRIGGMDYSESMITTAKKILSNCEELYCDEAVCMKTDIKYDAVIANSVFSYFPDCAYAEKVLSRMLVKCNNAIGILDIHDSRKKEQFLACRRAIAEDYDTRYEGLDKLFYEKEFFLDFAERHELNIKFVLSDIKGYWNNDFIFNCYMFQNQKA